MRHLHLINPAFRPEWVRKSWLFRARYAQPVPEVHHAQHIPGYPHAACESLLCQYEPGLSLGSGDEFCGGDRPAGCRLDASLESMGLTIGERRVQSELERYKDFR